MKKKLRRYYRLYKINIFYRHSKYEELSINIEKLRTREDCTLVHSVSTGRIKMHTTNKIIYN